MAVIYFRRAKSSEGKARTIQELLEKTRLASESLKIHVNGCPVVPEQYVSFVIPEGSLVRGEW
ncbi:MAG: hypothetical protein EG828_10005 [Deltaproteobacteria bacterium]|nr:hypothetical protein [Deltaproteobacteria bacterium]